MTNTTNPYPVPDQDPDPNDLMFTGGAPSFKFDQPGATIKGTVITWEAKQRLEYLTLEPLFYPDGKKKMQCIATLATDLRDPDKPDDDGHRRIFAPVNRKPGSMFSAIQSAVKAAGATKVSDDTHDHAPGFLAVQYTGQEAPERVGMSARNLFRAEYVPPTSEANALINEPAPMTGASAPPSLVTGPSTAPVSPFPASGPLA